MKTILDLIVEELKPAFTGCGYDEKYIRVTVSNRPDLCEYQCNGAMAAAKAYKKKPIDIANEVVEKGYLPERKAKAPGGAKVSSAYERLVAVGNMLMESIKRSRGRDNKSLARFADQLRQLLEKWES